MPEKNPDLWHWAFGLVLAGWSGLVMYFERVRSGAVRLALYDAVLTLFASLLAGLLTILGCSYFQLGYEASMICSAIAGGLGTKTIAIYERIFLARINSLSGLDDREAVRVKVDERDQEGR